MREIFTRIEEDGSEVIIEADMSAYAYSERYKWLFSVFVKFGDMQEGSEGFEEFLETKESLIIAVEHDEKAKYVGSRVVDGWHELYFYADDSKKLGVTVTNMFSNSGLVYESNIVKDAKWDFHYKYITPSELELAHIQSDKIIFLLEEEGDDVSAVRPVEHYLSFMTPTQKEKFVNSLPFEGFSFKDDISSDDFEYGIAVTKEHDVRAEVVKQEVETLFEAVKKEKGFYEGWSTVLVEK
jgi:regulator of RNase E activity RraB